MVGTSGKGKGKAKGKASARAKEVTGSTWSGIQFPVGKTHKHLKKVLSLSKGQRVSGMAAVYFAATMEYLVSEVLELAGNVAREVNVKRITPRHLQLAIRRDKELDLLIRATICGGGAVPCAHKLLIQKSGACVCDGDSGDSNITSDSDELNWSDIEDVQSDSTNKNKSSSSDNQDASGSGKNGASSDMQGSQQFACCDPQEYKYVSNDDNIKDTSKWRSVQSDSESEDDSTDSATKNQDQDDSN